MRLVRALDLCPPIPEAPPAPLFVVMYENRVGQCIERRITGQRIWKVVKAVGARAGSHALRPHALRHARGAELLRRTKNLRVVQD
jgi:site-specific recombinase XerD